MPEDEVPEIDLRIYRGLKDPYGGQIVPDDDEYTLGSITVANLNDTDGDGVVDNEDPQVLASDRGRDEVDLMKLTITKSGTFAPSCTHLDLEVSANAELWTAATKGTIAKRRYALSELPVTLWVEAKTYSEALRDIRVWAKVNGEVFDRVAATAVWLEAETTYTERKATPIPENIGIDFDTLQYLIDVQCISVTDGTRYGYGPYKNEPTDVIDDYLGGRILLEFGIKPVEIINVLSDYNMQFDGGRIIQSNLKSIWYDVTPIGSQVRESIQYPTAWDRLEKVNDDEATPSGDEDMVPLIGSTTLVFTFDSPGNPITLNPVNIDYAYYFRNSRFKEFVRISLNEKIGGNGEQGSRCSEYSDWEVKFSLSTNSDSRNSPYDRKEQFFYDPYWVGADYTIQPRLLSGDGNGDLSLNFLSAPYGIYHFRFDSSAKSWVVYFTSMDSDIYSQPVCTLNQVGEVWSYVGQLYHEGEPLGAVDFSIANNGTKPFTSDAVLSVPHIDPLFFHIGTIAEE